VILHEAASSGKSKAQVEEEAAEAQKRLALLEVRRVWELS
jgi:hypothetical protein